MSGDTKNNCPAFPVTVEVGDDGFGGKNCIHYPGMTLRDYFAGQALNGLLAADPECGFKPVVAAECAYRFADSMLVARGH